MRLDKCNDHRIGICALYVQGNSFFYVFLCVKTYLHVTSGIKAVGSNSVSLGKEIVNNQMFKCTERSKKKQYDKGMRNHPT